MQNDLINDDSDWPSSYECATSPPPAPPSQPNPGVTGLGAPLGAPSPANVASNLSNKLAHANPACVVVAPLTLPDIFKLSAFPAFMSRSAIFGVGRPGHGGPHRGWLQAAGNYKLNFEGECLSMLDKRVWEALVRIAKEKRIDVQHPFKVTLSAIARRAGVGGTGGLALPRVWACAERLAASQVQVDLEGSTRVGALLGSATKVGRAYFVQFDAEFAMAILASDIQFQFVDGRRARLKLPLAQWFHDHLSTHRPSPLPYTLGYLRDICGYRNQDSAFPMAVRKAMAELAAGCPGMVAGWSIDEVGVDSTCWRLEIERGAERPCPIYPASMKTSFPATKPSATKRRGGVAL